MAEKRAKALNVTISAPGYRPVRAELFPAEQWPARGGVAGLFRLRVNRKWVHAGYSFVDLMTAFGLLAGGVAEFLQVGLAVPKEARAPELPKGTQVRAPFHFRGSYSPVRSHTITEPMRERGGRWVVLVAGIRQPVAVQDLEVVEL